MYLTYYSCILVAKENSIISINFIQSRLTTTHLYQKHCRLVCLVNDTDSHISQVLSSNKQPIS